MKLGAAVRVKSASLVAPRRGAWIETSVWMVTGSPSSFVAPRRGAWIETPP